MQFCKLFLFCIAIVLYCHGGSILGAHSDPWLGLEHSQLYTVHATGIETNRFLLF